MPFIGPKPADTVLDSTLIGDGTITSAKIADGTIVDGDVGNVAATKLTGTIADARIGASSVTQHVTGYDDANIRADISALALREATNETSAAFNLPNSFIDTFATDVLGTKTTVSIENGYVHAKSTANTDYDTLSPTYTEQGSFSSGRGGTNAAIHSQMTDNTGNTGHGTVAGHGNNSGELIDFGQSYIFDSGSLKLGNYRTNGDPRQYTISYSTDNNTYSNIDFSSCSSSTVSSSGSASTMSSGTSAGVINVTGHSSNGNYSIINITTVPTFTARYIKVLMTSGDYHDNNAYISQFDWGTVGTSTQSATGTAIQNTNTVGSAKTEVSGTIIYKDNARTATLGTDLKIYFTCNGGTNWTEAASYNAITPVYATGIKQVRLGKTTCTSGTDIRYKAVWANQASGSKETQLHGIGINY